MADYTNIELGSKILIIISRECNQAVVVIADPESENGLYYKNVDIETAVNFARKLKKHKIDWTPLELEGRDEINIFPLPRKNHMVARISTLGKKKIIIEDAFLKKLELYLTTENPREIEDKIEDILAKIEAQEKFIKEQEEMLKKAEEQKEKEEKEKKETEEKEQEELEKERRELIKKLIEEWEKELEAREKEDEDGFER